MNDAELISELRDQVKNRETLLSQQADAIAALRERIRELESSPTSAEVEKAASKLGTWIANGDHDAIGRVPFMLRSLSRALEAKTDTSPHNVYRVLPPLEPDTEIARLLGNVNLLRIRLQAANDRAERAEAALAERDAAIKDAERYRWLRSCGAEVAVIFDDYADDYESAYVHVEQMKLKDELDAAIDTAIAQEKERTP